MSQTAENAARDTGQIFFKTDNPDTAVAQNTRHGCVLPLPDLQGYQAVRLEDSGQYRCNMPIGVAAVRPAIESAAGLEAAAGRAPAEDVGADSGAAPRRLPEELCAGAVKGTGAAPRATSGRILD